MISGLLNILRLVLWLEYGLGTCPLGPLLLLGQAFSKCQFDCIDGCAAELFCIFAGCGVV